MYPYFYSVVKINTEGYYDFQFQAAPELVKVKWVKIRNKGCFNVRNSSFRVVAASPVIDATVTLDNGQYTLTDLITEIQAKLTTVNAAFSVSYDNDLERLVIASSWNFTLSEYSDNFSRISGFTTDRTVALSHQSDFTPNLSCGGIGVLGLGSSTIKSNTPFNGCAFVIPNPVGSNEEIVFEGEGIGYNLRLDNKQYQKMNLKLVSEYADLNVGDGVGETIDVVLCLEYSNKK